jgi:uncharacterized protein
MCWKKKVAGGFGLLAIAGALFLLALFASTVKEYQFIGRNMPGELTTISVDGEGEAVAVPDMAEVSFSILGDAKDAASARASVDEKMKAIHEFLKAEGVAEADIKTTSYALNPKYEWKQTSKMVICPMGYGCPPVEGQNVLVGYEVSQSVDVRIKKIDSAGTILGGLTDKGASNVSGLTFKVADEDGLKDEARKEAIEEAKAKAKKLADELGVELVRMTAYNEGGMYPVYNYGRGGMMEAKTMAFDAATAPANIPVGENKIVSNVTIVYEVR